MTIIDKENKEEYEYSPIGSRNTEKTLCPKCSEGRKGKNKVQKCLTWNNKENVGFCHNCQSTFYEKKEFKYTSLANREYKVPKWENNTDLSDSMVNWFNGRGISQQTLRMCKITEGMEYMPQSRKEMNCVKFNYFRSGQLINTKYRDASKNFKMFKDAELILYGYDDIIGHDEIYIVEGEMDKLSLYEANIKNCVSVPNGANVGRANFDYLDNCIHLFEDARKIVIATDMDAPGVALRDQLAARFGYERCAKVDFGKYKDANEFLMGEGRDALIDCMKNTEDFPVEGIFTAKSFKAELDSLYQYGMPPGKKIDIPGIDDLISFETGRLYTWTGVPGHGKSEVIDFIIERLNIIHGYKAAYFSPENHPLQLHASKIIEKIVGARFSNNTMSPTDYESAVEYISDNFHFIEPEKDYKVDTILSKARSLIFKHGIKILVLDPYNRFEHKRDSGEKETDYISRFLDKLTTFAKKNNIMIFLVAHPTKMAKQTSGQFEVPTLYDINGSSNFFNKTDFGISVYLNRETGFSEWFVQKVKFKHLGEVGSAKFKWNKENGRYAYFNGDDINNIKQDNSNHLVKHYSEEIEPDNNFIEPPF